MTRKELIETPITNSTQAREFFHGLFALDLLFHPDDRAETLVRYSDGSSIFTDEEVPLVNKRVDECFTWLDDPYETCLELIR